MRIIGGHYKGMKIKAPQTSGVRPTSDQVREALFNILTNRIEGSFFVDLFAGSGGVGIEALSRGAKTCIFVEKNHQCVKIIKDNLIKLDLINKTNIYHCDVIAGLKRLSKTIREIDIFYIDPPYRSEIIPEVLFSIKENRLLNKEGVVIVEHFKKNELLIDNKGWTLLSNRNYGDTALSFLQIN